MAAPQQMGLLWPNGVFISDRDTAPDECSCPPCKALLLPCFYRPRWFRDKWLKESGAEGEIIPQEGCGCSGPASSAPNMDLMNGQIASFEKYIPIPPCFKCGAEDCCDDEMHVKDRNGNLIGKAFNRRPCFCVALCSDHILAEVQDRNSVTKFERMGQGQLCTWTEYRGETVKGNWHEYSFPLYRAGQHAAGADPVAYNTVKYWSHPICAPFGWCRPYGRGIKEFDSSLTPEEQTLLLVLVLRNEF